MVIWFTGQPGSGKTTLANEIQGRPVYLKTFGDKSYDKVIHIDCYREKSVERWIQLGIIEYFNSNSIILIEWPEVIDTILPKDVVYINFENIDINKRRIFSV